MRGVMLMLVLLMLPGLAMATSPEPIATQPVSVDIEASPPAAAGFGASLTGAMAAGAFVGAMVAQVVAYGVIGPALLAATPVGAAAALTAGGVYLYAGGIGGGLIGTWLYSHHATQP